MDINLYEDELKSVNLDFVTDYKLPGLDLEYIFSDKEPGGSHCVYILLDLWWKKPNRFWAYNLDYTIRYIGSGTFNAPRGAELPGYRWSRRPTDHKNDLFEKFTKAYPGRFKIVTVQDGLSKDESTILESYLINLALDKYGFIKAPKGLMEVHLMQNQLLNKKRERCDKNVRSSEILNIELFNENNFSKAVRG